MSEPIILHEYHGPVTTTPTGERGRLFTPVATALMIISLAGFALFYLVEPAQPLMAMLLTLDARMLKDGHVYQLVTHGLVNLGPWGLVGHLLYLFFIGVQVERSWGSWRFLGLLVAALALPGALLALVFEPPRFTSSVAAWAAMLAAYGWIYRRRRVSLGFTTMPVPRFIALALLVLGVLSVAPPPFLVLFFGGLGVGLAAPRLLERWDRRRERGTRKAGKASAAAKPGRRFGGIEID